MQFRQRVFPGSLAVTAVLAVAAGADATSVTPMRLAEIAGHAGQVIVGDVVETRSYWADAPRRIETEIILSSVQFLKGAHPDATDGGDFILVVPGGVVDGWSMRIEGAPNLQPGETWVLFLLPTCKVHPVVGLDQGAFEVRKDGVYQGGRAVTGLDTRGFVRRVAPAAASPGPAARPGDTVLIEPAPLEAASPMTYRRFVDMLGPTLAASRHHDLDGPAGRRVPADHTAVPLRGAKP